jgi:hypothetical protein
MIHNLEIKNGRCVAIDGKSFVKNQLKLKKLKNAIYIIRLGEEIIYVGETGRGIYRCIDGLTCSKNQPVAYPWRNHREVKNSNLQLMILGVGLPQTMAVKKSSREAVETDVASAIFSKKGSWPKKLTALKVHGGTDRTKTYAAASKKIIDALSKNGWL